MKNPDRDVTLDNRPCHGRVDSETCCLPLKKNCSANGKNKIYGCKIPFGILEVLCMITGVFAALLGFQAKNFPFAYIDTAPLVAGPRILMNSDSYFMFTGDYHQYSQKLIVKNKTLPWLMDNAVVYTMLDRELVTNWDVSDSTMSLLPEWRNSTLSAAQFEGMRSNNATYNSFEDIIIYSHFCMCKGWYPATGKLDKKTCAAAGKYCKPFVGNALAFIDLPKQAKGVVGSTVGQGMLYSVLFTIIATISRVVYVYWKPKMLMMPGTQWLTGFWAFLTCFMLWNEGRKISLAMVTDQSLGKYHILSQWTRGALPGGSFYTLGGGAAKANADGIPINQFLAHGEKLKRMGGWAMLLNLSLLFLSEYAYCTDCTHFAYLEDNLSVIRQRNSKKLAKRNSAVLNVKQL